MKRIALLVMSISIHTSVSAAAFLDTLKWKNPKVSVCFLRSADATAVAPYLDTAITKKLATSKILSEQSPTSRKVVNQIESTILQAYQPWKTGIHFEFKGDCDYDIQPYQVPRNRFADVAIVLYQRTSGSSEGNRHFGGIATLGSGPSRIQHEHFVLDSNPRTFPAVAIDVTDADNIHESVSIQGQTYSLPLQDHLNRIAIHEFGHLAGLAHEIEAYPEAVNDPACRLSGWSEVIAQRLKTFHERFSPEKFRAFTHYHATKNGYDPSSIMNECNHDMLVRTGLNPRVKFEKPGWATNAEFTSHPFIYPFFHTSLAIADSDGRAQLRVDLSPQDQEALRRGYGTTPSL